MDESRPLLRSQINVYQLCRPFYQHWVRGIEPCRFVAWYLPIKTHVYSAAKTISSPQFTSSLSHVETVRSTVSRWASINVLNTLAMVGPSIWASGCPCRVELLTYKWTPTCFKFGGMNKVLYTNCQNQMPIWAHGEHVDHKRHMANNSVQSIRSRHTRAPSAEQAEQRS